MTGRGATTVRIFREQAGAATSWSGEHTVAVAVAYRHGVTAGSVQLLDLGAKDPSLRFVMLAELAGDALVPLARAVSQLAREAGGTALRWVTETADAITPAVTRLGATPRSTVYRWWHRPLPGRPMPSVVPQVRTLEAKDGTFLVGWRTAGYGAKIDGNLATLRHDRTDDETTEVVTGLLSTVLAMLGQEYPGVRLARTIIAPDDDIHTSAAIGLGFTATPLQAIEYQIALS
ncbi:hypothetical protein [Amycolatopsis sp. NPDC059021]|uniref:hypothetical protein n=1 Tax=Amycolatopsis sp. NPDC059021 TaxID=3346704 RepID=UPI00366D322C